MKTKILLGTAALTALTFMAVEKAGAADADMTAEVIIRKALEANFTNNLNFGSLSATAAAGTVTLEPSTNNRTRTGGFNVAGGTAESAVLNVEGDRGATVNVSVSSLPVVLQHSTGADTLSINQFQVFSSQSANAETINAANQAVAFTLPAQTDSLNILVGATLSKGASAVAAGTYTSAAVTWNVNYQ